MKSKRGDNYKKEVVDLERENRCFTYIGNQSKENTENYLFFKVWAAK